MCLVDSKPKNFIWAHSSEANIKEPPEALKENGWRYGDIPTAANFNWIFNNLMNEMRSIWTEVKQLEEEKVLIYESIHFITERINKIVDSSNSHIPVMKDICDSLIAVGKECKRLIPEYDVMELASEFSMPTPIPTKDDEDDGIEADEGKDEE